MLFFPSDLATEAFADIHRVQGLRGVFIASQLSANFSKMSQRVGPEHLTSLITFDQGGRWQPISPPEKDPEGNPIDCSMVSFYYDFF